MALREDAGVTSAVQKATKKEEKTIKTNPVVAKKITKDPNDDINVFDDIVESGPDYQEIEPQDKEKQEEDQLVESPFPVETKKTNEELYPMQFNQLKGIVEETEEPKTASETPIIIRPLGAEKKNTAAGGIGKSGINAGEDQTELLTSKMYANLQNQQQNKPDFLRNAVELPVESMGSLNPVNVKQAGVGDWLSNIVDNWGNSNKENNYSANRWGIPSNINPQFQQGNQNTVDFSEIIANNGDISLVPLTDRSRDYYENKALNKALYDFALEEEGNGNNTFLSVFRNPDDIMNQVESYIEPGKYSDNDILNTIITKSVQYPDRFLTDQRYQQALSDLATKRPDLWKRLAEQARSGNDYTSLLNVLPIYGASSTESESNNATGYYRNPYNKYGRNYGSGGVRSYSGGGGGSGSSSYVSSNGNGTSAQENRLTNIMKNWSI